jgi:hypothetical protein
LSQGLKAALALKWIMVGVGGVAVLIGGGEGARALVAAWEQRKVLRTFEDGERPTLDAWESADDDADVARPALVATLTRVLRPAKTYGAFAVVVGEPGTGKLTAVRQAVRALPWPKGVVYVRAPSDVLQLGSVVGAAIGMGATPAEALTLSWCDVRDVLEEVGLRYRLTHGQPVTLVLDGADGLAREGTETIVSFFY